MILNYENTNTVDSRFVEQIELFRRGMQYVEAVRPCTVGDGITTLNEEQFDLYLDLFKEAQETGRLSKFVPASGAATRMFHSLNYVATHFPDINLHRLELIAETDKDAKDCLQFLQHIKEFAFYDELLQLAEKKSIDINFEIESASLSKVINLILNEDGLNYKNLPKGLVKFHKHQKLVYTAFDEHLWESAELTSDWENIAKVHFTVSEQYQEQIENYLAHSLNHYKDIEFSIEFSVQNKSTDTVAVDIDNNPIRDKNGNLVFRPGGHGALIYNLNECLADVVLIKNIDNVCQRHIATNNLIYKKLLIGHFISLQKEIFETLYILNQPEVSKYAIESIYEFCTEKLLISFPYYYSEFTNIEKQMYLKTKLNRPFRVCGMVKNIGEPGGGPFWVKDENSDISAQIIESAQFNLENAHQKAIFQSATHFNPVDLVCGIKDYKGNSFNLEKFIDKDQCFITTKFKEGREVKAMELPGLWNGAMAKWNTVFVELPLDTFSPVKVVNDLLKNAHKSIL